MRNLIIAHKGSINSDTVISRLAERDSALKEVYIKIDVYKRQILDRKMSSRAANHIEIVATLDEYNAINAFVRDGARSLMIVQKGEF